MNPSHMRIVAVTGLVGAVLLLAACGSGTSKPAHRTGSAERPSVTSYTDAVTKLHATVENANSAFFHTPRAKLILEARSLERAYAYAVKRLQAMTPPSAGVTQAHALLSAWRGAATDLTKVLSARPFDPGRAWTVAERHSAQSDQSYGSLLTIP
jgi:hypothetical protein